MKNLILVRHAKSSWDDLHLSDHDRPLNHRGEKDAPRMAKRLKEKRIFPDVLLSSTAKRALDTATVFASILKFPADQIHTTKKIYHANEDQLLSVIQFIKDLRDKEEVVLLFGHNPGLTEFTNALAEESIDNIPTCGIVSIQLKIKKWKDASFGCGELVFFDYPKRQE